MTRRDRPIEADSVTVNLDSRRDGTTAFEFSVNAAGVLSDAVRFDDTSWSADWDENWDARAVVGPRGWTAEIFIPLRILRFDASRRVQAWGFQVRRYISALQETDEWTYIPRSGAGEVSRYGRLENLVDLKAGNPIELRPFVLGKVRRRDPGTDTLAQGTDFGGSGGLDLKWHLTQNLTLDVALNPDFAQIEADQIVFNLTTYETRYPEKRPFFLEGLDVFATPFALLYTRRIGRAPPAPTLRTTPAEQLVDLPEPSMIYGAAKLVGKLGQRLTVGLLSAVTAGNDIQAQLPDGSRQDRPTDPATVYNALRLKMALGANSHLGLLATTTNRLESAGAYPVADPSTPALALCPGGQQVPRGARCLHDAYAGGLDWRWRSASGDYIAGGQLLGSYSHQGPPRTLLDGSLVASGDASGGGIVYFAKEGGKPWVGSIGYDGAGRKLDFNDLGFLSRQNYHSFWGDLGYRTLDPWWVTLETTTKLFFYQNWTWTGLKLEAAIGPNTTWKFSNFWSLYAEIYYRPAYFDDREVGDGTTLQHAAGLSSLVKVTSDPRRTISGELSASTFFRNNGSYFNFSGRLTLRLHPQLDLELLPEFTYSFGEPRYAAEGERPGTYYFGSLLGRSAGATLRATYTFTPRLSLQVFTQLYLAARHYWAFSLVQADPGGLRPIVHLRDLQPAPPPSTNPDTEEGVLNINVVLRWEYLLGSTLFLVYTRSQAPIQTLAPGQAAGLDLGAIPRGPAADVVMLKLTYWWG
jgi:hypothetical protein